MKRTHPDPSGATRRSVRRMLMAAVAGCGLAAVAALPASATAGTSPTEPLDDVPRPVIEELTAMLETIDDDRGLAVLGVMLPAATDVTPSEPGSGPGAEPWRLVAWVWAGDPTGDSTGDPAGPSQPCALRSGHIARCV